MTLPWHDESDLPDWDPDGEFEDCYDPANGYGPSRSMVTVELPPMPGEEQ